MHKGGQINNVQLITGLRIAEMSQLQNCSVMCTNNGSYCENEKKERKSQEGGGMCKKNGSYFEKDQRTNGPVNAHLISGSSKSTKQTKPGNKYEKDLINNS